MVDATSGDIMMLCREASREFRSSQVFAASDLYTHKVPKLPAHASTNGATAGSYQPDAERVRDTSRPADSQARAQRGGWEGRPRASSRPLEMAR